MPRKARIVIPGYPHHVVQRGHRKGAVFFSDFDRTSYLATLREFRESLGIKVYAYCLMTNHVHLILGPSDAAGISHVMKRLAGRHARRLNLLHGWKGTLWESRFKCSPIDTDNYLLGCGRYVDLNPVRGGMVAHPGAYPWSSYRARAGLEHSDILDEDPVLATLGVTRDQRGARYAEFVAAGCSEDELRLFRDAAKRNQLTGAASFVERVARCHGIWVPANKPGRPFHKRGDHEPPVPDPANETGAFRRLLVDK
jgi:putative transposase